MQLFGGGDELAKRKDIINPNLMTNTSQAVSNENSNTITTDNIISLSTLQLLGGKTVTISALFSWKNYMWGTGGRFGWELNAGVTNGEDFYLGVWSQDIKDNSTGQKVFTKTIQIPVGINSIKECAYYFYSNGSLKIEHLKLEEGSIATPWCPAYADYAMKSDLDVLKAEIDQLKQNK